MKNWSEEGFTDDDMVNLCINLDIEYLEVPIDLLYDLALYIGGTILSTNGVVEITFNDLGMQYLAGWVNKDTVQLYAIDLSGMGYVTFFNKFLMPLLSESHGKFKVIYDIDESDVTVIMEVVEGIMSKHQVLSAKKR